MRILRNAIVLCIAALVPLCARAEKPRVEKLAPLTAKLGVALEEELAPGTRPVTLNLTALVGVSTSCQTILTHETHSETELRVIVRGLASRGLCIMMEPPRPSARVDVSSLAGKRTLVLESAGATDRYELVVDRDRLGLTPLGPTSFSSTEAAGVTQRIPADVLWVIGTYSDEAAQQKLAPQLDGFIAALEAHGAKRYEPIPARYAGSYLAWSRLAPDAKPERHVETYVYLRYDGKDLTFVAPLVKALGASALDDKLPHRGFLHVHLGSSIGQIFNSRR